MTITLRRWAMILSLFAVWIFIAGRFAVSPATLAADDPQETKLVYPKTRQGDQVDNYHGVKIADPFRWLEDPDSEQTKAWVEAQNKVTFGFLENIPQRQAIKNRLTKLWNYERFGNPRKKGGKYFYERNDGLQNQDVLYVADTLDGKRRVLLDPNKLSKDGTVSLKGWQVSDDGRLLAYGVSSGGSDWETWRFLDISSGRKLDDQVNWVKFSNVSWTADSQGIYYSRYDAPKEGEQYTGELYYQKLYFHRIGQPQEKDKLVYQRKDQKDWGFGGQVSEDGRYLIITVWRGTEQKNQIFYKDLTKKDAQVVELISGFKAEYQFIGNEGPLFWLMTDRKAPMRRIIAIDVTQPDPKNWREIIPESQEVIEGVGLVNDQFLITYLKDASSQVKVFDLEGKHLRDVELPGIGSVGGFGGERKDRETFYSFANFTTPTTIYHYDAVAGKSRVFRRPDVDFNSEDYQTEQVFYSSRDGTKAPMFISYKKGLKKDGDNPTMLYGYGGFNISITPRFSVMNLVWMERGGVFAVPNLRGGGEYGRAWHEAGMLDRKQNVFDDFIAAAQWLIDHKYTSPKKLAIRGGSNGGLLVGACMTQRPDLFAVALPAVGVMDMLRYHKFTIGWAWVNEYGSSDDPQQFKTLRAYSPLHNLKKGVAYPATLVTTADHDDRVVPAHSHKFAATLQQAHRGPAPVLIRIETRAGHGAGKPTTKLIEEAADVLAFTFAVMGEK